MKGHKKSFSLDLPQYPKIDPDNLLVPRNIFLFFLDRIIIDLFMIFE